MLCFINVLCRVIAVLKLKNHVFTLRTETDRIDFMLVNFLELINFFSVRHVEYDHVLAKGNKHLGIVRRKTHVTDHESMAVELKIKTKHTQTKTKQNECHITKSKSNYNGLSQIKQ